MPPSPTPAALRFFDQRSFFDPIAHARAQSRPKAHLLPSFRLYAAGEQPNCLTDKQKETLAGLFENGFCDNAFHQILSIDADRIEFERFDVADETVKAHLDELRVKSALEGLDGQKNYNMVRDGDAYIGLTWDADARRVLPVVEEAWDGQEGMWLAYTRTGIPAYAVKEWTGTVDAAPDSQAAAAFRAAVVGYEAADALSTFTNSVANLTGTEAAIPAPDAYTAGTSDPRKVYRWRVIYYPDRIEWYRSEESRAGGRRDPWEVYAADGAPNGKIDNTDAQNNPLGILILHYPNAAKPEGFYGGSEVGGGVRGGQDQINDIHFDLCGTGRFTGFQRTWTAGMGQALDPDTREPLNPQPPVDTSPGANLDMISSDARMGVIPAGDSSNLIAILDTKLETLGRMTSTPYHLLKQGVTSGEMVVRLEAPLVNKTRKQANRCAVGMAQLAHLAVKLANHYGDAGLNEDALITAVYAPTDKRDPLTLSAIATSLFPIVGEEETLNALGYPPEKVQKIMADNAAARQANMDAELQKQSLQIDLSRAQARTAQRENG